MKFLFVSNLFWPAKGGSSIFRYLAEELAQKGEEVTVLTSDCYLTDDFVNPNRKGITPLKEEKGGVKIIRLPVFSRGRRLFRLGEVLGSSFCGVAKRGPIFSSLGEILRKREVDWVVSGFFPFLASFWGWLIKKRNRSRLALLPAYHFQEEGYENSFLWWLLKRSDLVLCLTHFEKKLFHQKGIDPRKLRVIGGAVEDFLLSSPLTPFPAKPKVLFLGVKSAHKRVPLLLEAMKILWKEGEEAELIIAGPETFFSPKIKKKIVALPRQWREKISYHSEVSEKRKKELIDQSWVLVNPSAFESFGLVFIESWARGRPVIGRRIPTLEELVSPGKDGFLFLPGSARDLAEKIKRLIRNKELAEGMGRRGRRKVERYYTRQALRERFLKIIRRRGR